MFEKIDIGIKTFLRDECLFNTIRGIKENYPGARMVIVDDGDQTEEKDGVYADLRREGHIIDILPFDSGFGKKSNRIVELSNRPYILIGSDDFDFDKNSSYGLAELENVLNWNDGIDIVSGRVNGRKYEYFLDVQQVLSADFEKRYYKVIERQVTGLNLMEWYFDCDLTVNYSLIRRRVFWKPAYSSIDGDVSMRTSVQWDDDVKIGGGEHGAFFFDCKLAGYKTVCCPRANINEQHTRNSPRYKEFRSRANSPERPCFDKRNITSYILGDGRIDYRR